MLEKFLQEVVQMTAGSSADKLVEVLAGKKNVNEFLIAKKLNFTINQTRNILYKLADVGLVYFNRKKDSKSGGWYTYFWTLDEQKCLAYYQDRLLRDIENLNQAISTKKTTQFYHCKTCGMEQNEEQALLNDFTCSECGTVFDMKNSSDSIKDAERQLQRLRTKLVDVETVLNSIIEENNKKNAKLEAKNKTSKKKSTRSSKKDKKKSLKKPSKKKKVKQ
jgi:transcription factor E